MEALPEVQHIKENGVRRTGNSNSVTISTVAQEAGVGLGTVSRVLNNHPSVSSATRQAVLEAMKKLGYQPNEQARRLARGLTETICFVLSNRSFMHSFHGRILQGVESHCSSVGRQVVFTTCRYSSDVPPSALQLPAIIRSKGAVDGFILAGTNYPNFLAALEQVELPFVFFGNNLIGQDCFDRPDTVLSDDTGGAYAATRHLQEIGHKKIAYVGNISYPWFRRRYEGYVQAMTEAGLQPMSVEPSDTSVNYGLGAVREIVNKATQVTAIFAGNDHVAYGVWRGLREAGLSIPDDVSLVGFDDREESLLTEPPLTTVRVFKEEVGAECARMLLKKIESPNAIFDPVVLPTELLIRGSTAPPKHR